MPHMAHAARAAFVFAVVVGFALPGLAEEPAVLPALRMAEKHASLATDARRLPDVRMHLHHVLDCLEGARGRDHDATGGDPCRGKGALESLSAGSANQARARKAIEVARVGVTFHDFQPAHDSARTVKDVLAEATSPATTR